MAPGARELLDTAMDAWQAHLADRRRDGTPMPNDPAYSFAYWLFRYSGLVAVAPTSDAGSADVRERIMREAFVIGRLYGKSGEKESLVEIEAQLRAACGVPAPRLVPDEDNGGVLTMEESLRHSRALGIETKARPRRKVRLPAPASIVELDHVADAARRLCGALHNGETPTDEDFRAVYDWASGVLATRGGAR